MISFEFLKQSPISSPRTSPPPSPASSDRVLALHQNATVPSPRARSSSSGSFSSSSGPPSGGFSASPLLARDDHWTSQLTAEQLKELSYEQRQKQEALQEIVLAERAYVRDLRLITRVFMDEMRDRGMVTKEEAASIFSNIPTLLDVHTGLLTELEQLKREQGMISDEGLGNIFLERTNLFKHYAHYCVNHISMSQKLAALRENHKIAEFLEDCKKIPECRSSGVESFLITPLQRMVKYPLLLASLLKYVDKENPEYAPLAKAYEEIKNVVDQVNKRAQQEEDVHKVMDLQSAVELVHGPEVYKFCEWGRHIVKEGPVRLLGGRRKSKNQDFHLVLFNDKIALFRVKAKGKRKGYKVLHIWEGHMLSCSPLECPPPTLAASSPSQGSTPPVNRLRAFSRNNTDNVLTSPRTVSPAHSSPRGRSVRNLREETETIDEVVRVLMNLTGDFKECGLRLVEKEKEWIEYRVLFGSVAEKEDWIAKMKVLKVEFQGSESSGDGKAISPDAVNALVWEKRYHLEVGIRTELKRVLDTTTHQLNEARDEIETLKKEREKLRKKIARLKESKKKKKEQREREKKEERKEVGRRAKERDRVQQMEERKPKDRDWLNIGGRLRSLSSEIDEVIFQRFEHQDQVQQLRVNNRPGGLSHSVEMPRVQESSGNNEAQPHTKDGGKGKSTTLGRKSMVTTHRRKERDRMLFLDLPFRAGSSTSRGADASTTSGGEEPLKPCSAREPRARPDGAQGSPKPVRKKSTPTKDLEPLTGGAEVLSSSSKSSPRTPDPKKPSPRGGATDQSASTGGSPANDKREARKSLPRREHDVGKGGSPRASTKDQEQPGAGPAGGERSSPRTEGVRRSSALSDKHERKSSPRKDHERAAHGTSGLSTSSIVGMPSTGDVLERRLHQSD